MDLRKPSSRAPDPTTPASPGSERRREPERSLLAQVGPYEIDRHLGRGGMGTVYAAKDMRRGVWVALKTLPATIDDIRLRALRREFRTMSDFAHPQIVRLYDLFRDETGWYLVMELVDGVEFRTYVRGGDGRFGCDETRIRNGFSQLISGMHALHAHGWIHRDLKSSNVLVEHGTDRVVILDFGLTESLQSSERRERNLLGTRTHMAPELLLGEAANPATDLYAVGVMLWDAIQGEIPAALSAMPAETKRARLAGHEGVSAATRDLCLALLAQDPQRRPSTLELYAHFGMDAPPIAPVRSVVVEGREPELAALRRAFGDVEQGGTLRVDIVGAAGFGKSTLIELFVESLAAEDSAFVFCSRCRPNERIPFKAVDALVESIVAEWLERAPADSPLDTRVLSGLVELFPTIADLPGFLPAAHRDSSRPPAQRRAEVFEVVGQLLHSLSQLRPLVLVVDDAHWGDTDSALLLRTALQRQRGSDTQTARILAIYSFRPGHEDSPFLRTAALSSSVAAERVMQLCLAPLDSDAALRIVRAQLPHATTDQIAHVIAASTGVPLMLVRGSAVVEQRSVGDASSLLETLVEAELADAAPATRRLLELVAIASVPLEIDVAIRATGIRADWYRSISELRVAQLVSLKTRSDGWRPQIEICHELLRGPTLAPLSAPEIASRHLALATVLETIEDTPPSILAAHLAEAGERRRASRYSLRAAEAANTALAFASAAQHYRDALAWGELEIAEHSRLQVRLAEALFSAGECVDAAEKYALARSASAPEHARLLRQKETEAWLAAGHVDRASQCIRPVLHELRLSPPPAMFIVPAILAKVLTLRMRRVTLQRMDSSDDDKAFRADVCWAVGQGLIMFLSARGAYFAIQSLVESLPLGDSVRTGRGLAFLGGVCSNAGGPLARWGEEYLREAEAIAARTDNPYLRGCCLVWRCNVELVSGRFVRAIELGEQGVRLMEQTPYSMSWECHTARCFALMARERIGDLVGVERRAQEIVEQAAVRHDLYGRVVFSLFIAPIALASGQVSRARAIAQEALAAWTRDSFTVQHFYALRAQAYCDLYEERWDHAWTRVTSMWNAIQRSDVFGVPSARMDALLLLGHVELARAKHDAQRRRSSLRTVLRVRRTLTRQSPEAAAHAFLLEAAWRNIRNGSAHAHPSAVRATAAFASLGMTLWASAAEQVCSSLNPATAQRGDDSALRELGVQEPARWLAMFGSWHAYALARTPHRRRQRRHSEPGPYDSRS